jgi:hypothetical protein
MNASAGRAGQSAMRESSGDGTSRMYRATIGSFRSAGRRTVVRHFLSESIS